MHYNSVSMQNLELFHRRVQEYLEELWKKDPVTATSAGVHQWDDRLPSLTETSLKERSQWLRKFEKQLRQDIPPKTLSLSEQLDYQALLGNIHSELLDIEQFQWHKKLPALYLDSVLYGVLLLLIHDFAPLPQRAKKVLGRLKELPRLFKEGSRQIQNTSQIYLDIGIEILLNGKIFINQLIPSLAQKTPELSSEFEAALKEANLSFEAFLAFLEVLKDTATAPFAVGEKLFLEKIKADFEMDVSCQQLIEQAKNSMIQIRAEIEKLRENSGLKEDLASLFSKLKEQSPSPDKVIRHYQSEVARAREWILKNKLTPIAQGETLEVVPTPEFERPTTPYAAYISPAPFDAIQKGFFWVTPILESASQREKQQQLQGHCIPGIPVTVAHEAYPGHHLQLSYTNHLESLFRKASSNTMTCEGWAHYCEHLMNEHGFYQDTATRLFFLRDSLWRACRVLVDVGLHTQGMTIVEATQFLVKEAFLEPANAVAEVKRYTMSPTQPLCYLVGKLEILKLREECRKKKGSGFSLYEFHERFLRASSLPIPLIRKELLS